MRSSSNWWLLVVVLLLVAGCQGTVEQGLSTTAYESEKDVYIVFEGKYFDKATALLIPLLPPEVIEEALFDLQEGTHEKITDVSGAKVDHYYIWVCLGRACIPVDPFSFSR